MLNAVSKYAVKYDENCPDWENDKDYNLMYLNRLETYCNDMLFVRGYLFLRDVYERMGIPVTRDSCCVGWIFEENNIIGDNYVKFDIQEDSYHIIVDFNVDGNILDRI